MKREIIIVNRTDKVGDVIVTIPSIYMLRKMFPDFKIIVIVSNYNKGILERLDYIDGLINIKEYSYDDFIKKIREIKPYIYISFVNSNYISKLAIKSGAKLRVGVYSKFYSWFVYNKGIFQRRSKSEKHEAEYNLDLVENINKELFKKNYEINNKIYYSTSESINADNFYHNKGINGFRIVINMFTGQSSKRLSIKDYIRIISKLLKNKDNSIILLSYGEEEVKISDNIVESLEAKDRIYIYRGVENILETVAIIDRADLYIGGSTGTTHIAGSLDKKIIAIYPSEKSQSPLKWGPYRAKYIHYIMPDEDSIDKSGDEFDEISEKFIEEINAKVEEYKREKNGS